MSCTSKPVLAKSCETLLSKCEIPIIDLAHVGKWRRSESHRAELSGGRREGHPHPGAAGRYWDAGLESRGELVYLLREGDAAFWRFLDEARLKWNL